MKPFKQYLNEAMVNTDNELIKALQDLEANTSGKSQQEVSKILKYIEANEVDQKAASMFNQAAETIVAGTTQRSIVNAVEQYFEQAV